MKALVGRPSPLPLAWVFSELMLESFMICISIVKLESKEKENWPADWGLRVLRGEKKDEEQRATAFSDRTTLHFELGTSTPSPASPRERVAGGGTREEDGYEEWTADQRWPCAWSWP